jgi:hypothetical protein
MRRRPLAAAIGAAALAWAGCGWPAEGPSSEAAGLGPGAPGVQPAREPGSHPAAAGGSGLAPALGGDGEPALRVGPDSLAGSAAGPAAVEGPLRFAQAAAVQGAGTAPARQPDLFSAIRWELARPLLRWSGFIGLDYFIDKSDLADARTFNAFTTLLGTAETYLWQPWFAQLRGNLGVSAFYNRTESGETGAGVGGNPEQTSYGWNGGGRVNVFPFSRFPFEAYLDKSDSRTDATLFTQSVDNLRLGLRQRYQTPRGDQNYAFSWDRSILSQSFTNVPEIEDTLDVFVVNGSYGIPDHSLAAGIQWDRNRRNDGFASDNLTAVAQHTWVPSAHWNLNTNASLRNTEISQPPVSDTETRFAQIYSLGNWTPADRPLTAFGTLRLATTRSRSGASETDGYDAAAAAAATYYYSRNTSFSGSLSVNTSDIETFTTVVASAYHAADAIALGPWQYFWNASGTVNNVAGGSNEGTSASATLGQSLSRSLGQWWGGETNTNLGLSLGTTAGSGAFASSSTAGLNGNLSWTRSIGSTQATASLSVSDNMTFGDVESDFLLVNAQATLNGQLSRYSAWNGNLTAQWTRENRDNPQLGALATELVRSQTGSTQTYLNANVGYTHFRVFGVPRLVLTSNLRTYSNDVKRSEGNLLALPVFPGLDTGDIRETALEWDNRLFYTIGKTELELRAIVNTIDVNQGGATTRWQVGIRILRRLGF